MGFDFAFRTIKKNGNLSDIHDNLFCKNYDFHASVCYSPHTDDEIMIDTSFDSASSYEEIEGLTEKSSVKWR